MPNRVVIDDSASERQLRKVAFEWTWNFQQGIEDKRLTTGKCCICKTAIETAYHCFCLRAKNSHVHVHDRCMPNDLRVALVLSERKQG